MLWLRSRYGLSTSLESIQPSPSSFGLTLGSFLPCRLPPCGQGVRACSRRPRTGVRQVNTIPPGPPLSVRNVMVSENPRGRAPLLPTERLRRDCTCAARTKRKAWSVHGASLLRGRRWNDPLRFPAAPHTHTRTLSPLVRFE